MRGYLNIEAIREKYWYATLTVDLCTYALALESENAALKKRVEELEAQCRVRKLNDHHA